MWLGHSIRTPNGTSWPAGIRRTELMSRTLCDNPCYFAFESYFSSSINHNITEYRLPPAAIDRPQQMCTKWLSVERKMLCAMPHQHGFTGRLGQPSSSRDPFTPATSTLKVQCTSWLRRDLPKTSPIPSTESGNRCEFSALIGTLDDANTKNAVTWTKVDKELPQLNGYLELLNLGPLDARKDVAICTFIYFHYNTTPPVHQRMCCSETSLSLYFCIPNRLPEAPGSMPRQTAASPDNRFCSTTTGPLSTKDCVALRETSLIRKQRPNRTQSGERGQVAEPIEKSNTCVDLDIGECSDNCTTRECETAVTSEAAGTVLKCLSTNRPGLFSKLCDIKKTYVPDAVTSIDGRPVLRAGLK
ncbi:LOW QUALITY PROTEIN: hypothetical protein T265_13270 [Opisthorchis viverrini]|uniref:Uncharacterized protein n=1 Tax=Opisthorchis viverrini TaxID=6198 RepID=A0A075A364_OPIVI|nr:LOW QUALITY PROTEIN: hypothetical protein T265_13270 [Opisthorchis viverrini]KER30020.1 LOW QUALITY PROTEIN: hypothetical protein T265_13270 [Opisthorchis viverrini]